MRVFAVNGSPRMKKGHTHRVLTAFLDGMSQARAEVGLVFATRLNIKPCVGDFSCWYEKPGSCIYHDDMDAIYPKVSEADILVLAAPVYIPLPGEMQNLVNRLVPLIEPRLVTRDGRTRARFRSSVRIRQIVLVSSGGWWEKANFEIVEQIVKELASNSSVEYAGAVLRPHAFQMLREAKLTDDGAAVLDAAARAGYELISEGRMNPTTLEAVSRPLMTNEELLVRYNQAL